MYTPHGYDTSRDRFPVQYLQDGAGESERGWSQQGRANFILDNLIAERRAVPMLVVMDNGCADLPPRQGQNATGQVASAFDRVLLEDLIPKIDHDFRTLADAEHRAIAGLSMGGGQALTIGLQHLDKFRSIGCFSGAVRQVSTSEGPLANPTDANRKIRLLWIGCGIGDGLYSPCERLHSSLDLAGIRHNWFTGPGSHEWQVWRNHLHAFAPLLFRPRPDAITATDLLTEYLRDPLGLDIVRPRLSWRIDAGDPDARGIRQTGYQVLVAGSRTVIDSDKGDLWTSGTVAGEHSVNIEYAGKPLMSDQECWWKVRVKDERGQLSGWSAPARWTVGPLRPEDWKAE